MVDTRCAVPSLARPYVVAVVDTELKRKNQLRFFCLDRCAALADKHTRYSGGQGQIRRRFEGCRALCKMFLVLSSYYFLLRKAQETVWQFLFLLKKTPML